MSYDFNDELPIYLQIMEHIKTLLITKKLLPNQKLPSVRDLSFEFEVNPNTIQKALFELENLGLIYTERTNGKFVTADEKLIENLTKQTIKDKIEIFYDSMNKLGINREQTLKILNDERSEK